jgi:hypothetical protein
VAAAAGLLRTSEFTSGFTSVFLRVLAARLLLQLLPRACSADIPCCGPIRSCKTDVPAGAALYQRWRSAPQNQRYCPASEPAPHALRLRAGRTHCGPQNAYVRVVIIPLLPRATWVTGGRWSVLPYIGILGAALRYLIPALLHYLHSMGCDGAYLASNCCSLGCPTAAGCTGTLLELWGTIQHRRAASGRRCLELIAVLATPKAYQGLCAASLSGSVRPSSAHVVPARSPLDTVCVSFSSATSFSENTRYHAVRQQR